MNTRMVLLIALATGVLSVAAGQTADAYKDKSGGETKSGLLDPARFSMHQSLSFGMAAASKQNVQSASLATTMFEYRLSKPLTLNLDFGFPIHSTYNEAGNLTRSNIESADYFRNMPLAAALTWQPRPNLLMRVSFVKDPGTLGLAYPSALVPAPGMFGQW